MSDSARIVLYCLLPLLSAISAAQDLSSLDLVGKSKQQIRDVLGDPLSCKQTYQGTACTYGTGKTEIIYIGERADWITFSELEDVPFTARALRHVGLVPAPPLRRNPTRMHWLGHQGLEVITVHGAGDIARVIQIRAYTPN